MPQRLARHHPLAVLALLVLLPACASRPAASTASASGGSASPGAAPSSAPTTAPDNNAELQALCDADQADRQDLGSTNWLQVSARDKAREQRVREMLDASLIRTPRDYFNAALICQHSMALDGIQLAHELAMISASQGDSRARWLMAASYDRLLNRLGQPQRFATQYSQKSGEPYKLGELRPGVTDDMRRAINVPTLDEARAREAQLNEPATTPTPH